VSNLAEICEEGGTGSLLRSTRIMRFQLTPTFLLAFVFSVHASTVTVTSETTLDNCSVGDYPVSVVSSCITTAIDVTITGADQISALFKTAIVRATGRISGEIQDGANYSADGSYENSWNGAVSVSQGGSFNTRAWGVNASGYDNSGATVAAANQYSVNGWNRSSILATNQYSAAGQYAMGYGNYSSASFPTILPKTAVPTPCTRCKYTTMINGYLYTMTTTASIVPTAVFGGGAVLSSKTFMSAGPSGAWLASASSYGLQSTLASIASTATYGYYAE
jgi:hypothetical protein